MNRPIKIKFVNEAFIKQCHYGEKKLIKLRQNVNLLYFNHHLSKNMIARKKGLSKKFVIKWTKSPNQDFSKDNRGWQKGKRRKWSRKTEKKVQAIYNALKKKPQKFYLGATTIEQEWRKRYPQISPPPLRTIGQILSDLGLSQKRRKDRNKGAAKYLCYPEYTVFNIIAKRILELDFIGRKFIKGQTEPLNFIASSFKNPPLNSVILSGSWAKLAER
jgi:transposase